MYPCRHLSPKFSLKTNDIKLRINTKLRAALIAAITAVGFTLPQTYGTVSWNGGGKENAMYYANSGGPYTLVDTDNNAFQLTAEPSAANATVTITSVTTKDGANFRIVGGNYWGGGRSFKDLQIETLQAGTDGSGVVLVNTVPYASDTPVGNTVATIQTVAGTLGGVSNYAVLTIGTGSSTIHASGSLDNVRDGATLTLNGTYTFDTTDASKYTVKQEGSATWSDEANKQGFKKTSGSSYYAIKGATEGTNFSVSGLEKESDGNYYFTAGDVTDYSKFYVKAATATLEGVNASGQIIVEHNGATLTVQNAQYRDTSGSKNLNIVVGDGGVLETTHSGVSGFITGTLTINAGGIMRIVGQHDAFGWGSKSQCVASLTMEGTSEKEARLELNQSTGNSATMVTDITMKGYSTITSTKAGGSAGFNTFGCAITAENVQNTIDVLDTRRNGVTITVAKDGELTVKKQTINGSDHSAASVVVKQGEGTLRYTGETKAEGLNIQAGTVEISGTGELHALTIGTDGSLSITGGSTTVTGNGNVLSNTIAVTAGTLTLSGKYEIGGNTGTMATTYEGGVSSTDNGFAHTAGSATVYTKAGDATVNVDNATFTVGGTNVDVVNGVYTTEGSTNYGTFYVKSGTESLAHAIQYAGEHEHTVSTIAVTGTSTVSLDKEGASVALTLAGGAVGTLDTTAATTLTGVSGAGALVKAGAETLTITGSNTAFTGDVTISAGTLKIGDQRAFGEHNNGKSQTKTITIEEGGTLDLNGVTDANFKYTMAGGTLTNSGAALGAGSSQTTGLDLTADSTVHVDSGHDLRILARGYDPTALNLNSKTLVKTGDGLFALKNTTVSAGTIEVQGGEVNFEVDPVKGGSTAANITLKGGNLSGTMNVSANITIDAQETTSTGVGLNMNSHNLTLNVAEGKELSLTGSITNGASYTKNGAGTLNLGSLDVTAGEFNAAAGTVNLDSLTKSGDGGYTLSGDGTVNLGYFAVDLQAGKLTMSGKYDISNMYVDGETTYIGGVNEENGFAQQNGTVKVVEITDGAELDAASGTFSWCDTQVALDATGAASVSGTNYGTFYVNAKSETVTQAKGHEHGSLASIYVEEGATLEVDDDINGSLIDGWSTGTVNIQESMTVTGTMEGVTLSGAGTYDLGSGVSTLGEDTSLGEYWRGIVRISNVTKNNIDLAPFVNGTLSTVELKGFSGWTGNNLWKGLNPQNIKLTNTEDGGVAWYSNAFSSSKTDTAVYSGKWSGEGTYVTDVNADRYLNHTYSGDIADWKGVFEKRGDGTSILTFIDNAEEVNVEIKRTAGTLNLVVGNGKDPFDAVFHEEVSVTSVEVKANASATFMGQLTTTTVTNADTVEFNALSGLTQAINNSGTVIFNEGFEVSGFQETASEEGYYDLNGAFSSDGNGYSGNSDSYLTIVNGGTVQGKVKVEQEGTVYTMSSDGRALKGDGGVTDWDTFHVNTDTVQVSDIVNSEHGATTVEVHSGTLNVDQATDLAITVTDEGTLTGEKLDTNEVGIGIDATAHFVQGIDDASGVRFTTEEGTVDVKNNGAYPSTYTTGNGSMDVQADAVTLQNTATDAVSVDNALTVKDIINESVHELAVTNLVVDSLSTVSALSGDIDITSTQGDVVIAALNIVDGNQVFVHNGPEETEVTVTVTETLAAGNGTLLANLVMADDSALLVDGAQKALHVGSTLTMGSNIALDGTTLQALDDLAIGEYFWLINAADGHELVYEGPTGDNAWYDSMFSRIATDSDYKLNGDFNIVFDSTDGFGLQKSSSTPEPTTGTLSLLALAALAARRRRK